MYHTKMTRVIRTLFFVGAAVLTLAEVHGVPTRYDQRQEGNSNLHAQLENFLFVIAVPSSNEFFSDLALQALEFKQQLSSRAKPPKEQESIRPLEEVPEDKPHILEVIRISDNYSDKGNSTQEDEEALNIGDLQLTLINGTREEAKHVERVAKNVKSFEFPKNREVPAILGYLVDTSRRVPTESKTENGGRAWNVLEKILRNPDVDPAKPGTSAKKQLFRKREENAAPSSNVHKNDVGSTAEKKQEELTLLGATENCGPGRRRDAAGVCQFDESADSFL